MLRATGLKPEEVIKDSIRINERQNIVVVSAPTLERAEKYTPEDTSKGIIRGIPDYDTPEDIEGSLVNERNPGILHAKRMGHTNLAIIVFRGTDHPTGDRKCKVRFKTPYVVKKRQWERKLQDEETLRERQRSVHTNRNADGAGIKKDDFPALDDGAHSRVEKLRAM
ncbi:hypothetical protein HPB49_005484 [Dermacentor silvarum]|uniref:Uncharacterized protein n=1 Tax=Dermacentor silvarum TaxID=543639 RepID=A0ACB8DV85_DERSI|nr:hypothetical protein HPB49_005484 [Dermacentor silvarum]